MMARLALTVLVMLVSACGFTPIYGPEGAVGTAMLDRLQVAPMPERLGQVMRNRLMENLGAGDIDFELKITLRENLFQFGRRGEDLITGAPGDAAATQEQVTLYADYELVDLRNETVLISDTLVAESSFDLVLSDFAIVTQRENTFERLALQIADRLERRLALYFNNNPVL